jgi:hypothetical protein
MSAPRSLNGGTGFSGQMRTGLRAKQTGTRPSRQSNSVESKIERRDRTATWPSGGPFLAVSNLRIRKRPAECESQRRSARSLQTPGMHGWGGRIRTSGWRNQNPLPYHLATPQCSARLERALAESGRTIVRAPRHRNGRQDEICAVLAFAADSTIRNRHGATT